jgi:hypothetical protein
MDRPDSVRVSASSDLTYQWTPGYYCRSGCAGPSPAHPRSCCDPVRARLARVRERTNATTRVGADPSAPEPSAPGGSRFAQHTPRAAEIADASEARRAGQAEGPPTTQADPRSVSVVVGPEPAPRAGAWRGWGCAKTDRSWSDRGEQRGAEAVHGCAEDLRAVVANPPQTPEEGVARLPWSPWSPWSP